MEGLEGPQIGERGRRRRNPAKSQISRSTPSQAGAFPLSLSADMSAHIRMGVGCDTDMLGWIHCGLVFEFTVILMLVCGRAGAGTFN